MLSQTLMHNSVDLIMYNRCDFSRFNDIHVPVRLECVKFASHCLMNHPDLARDLTGVLLLVFLGFLTLCVAFTHLSPLLWSFHSHSALNKHEVYTSFSLFSNQSIWRCVPMTQRKPSVMMSLSQSSTLGRKTSTWSMTSCWASYGKGP